ncbi:hypothetical protein JHK85_007201 [Glycine max]|nr:hypothetical protein JHK85_007201 [Glycine max]KAH1069282.1 hypothetical protein GYH30_006761 [Glycine max]
MPELEGPPTVPQTLGIVGPPFGGGPIDLSLLQSYKDHYVGERLYEDSANEPPWHIDRGRGYGGDHHRCQVMSVCTSANIHYSEHVIDALDDRVPTDGSQPKVLALLFRLGRSWMSYKWMLLCGVLMRATEVSQFSHKCPYALSNVVPPRGLWACTPNYLPWFYKVSHPYVIPLVDGQPPCPPVHLPPIPYSYHLNSH